MLRTILSVLCCAVLWLPGCRKKSEARYTVAVIAKGTTHEFWKTVEAGAREAGEKLNVEIKWQGPTKESEHAEQKNIFNSMVSLGVDGIALAPTNERILAEPVEAASDQGMPVVIFDSNIDTEKYVSFVATDNEKGGRLAGEKLLELLGDKGGRVVLLRYDEGSGSTLRREGGFMKVIEGRENVKLIDKQFPQRPTLGDAMTTAVNMLSTKIENNKLQVEGVFASNEPTSVAMLNALERLRKQGVELNVKFVGFDSSEALIQGLEEGTVDALVVQNPKRMGYLAVETLVNHLDGKEVPRHIDTGVEVVTAESLKDPDIRALLGIKDE